MANRRSKSSIKEIKKQQIINNKKLEEEYINQYEGLTFGTAENVSNPARISFSLIAKRNLAASVANGPHEKLIESLTKISHVRLDRENIEHIDNLEMLGPVTNLYLQQNMIQRIENLESLCHLRFLVLSGNKIEKVKNLHSIKSLMFLDLSENLIVHLDIDELPPSLIILNMSGNECTKENNYRPNTIKSLRNLKQLDNVEISKQEKQDVGIEVSSSDEEETEDEELQVYVGNLQLSGDSNDLFQTSTEIIQRSKERMKGYNIQHDAVLDELETFRSQSELGMNTTRAAGANSAYY
ncbi:leucine-rich repeat-containing protein 46-like [Antedon mediterranea]|uniref:leucine-rich repeat-containing protein 46-like n=1 Tax=Antedon mediterranea TaxID=105859 RepID=UPI003AF9A698